MKLFSKILVILASASLLAGCDFFGGDDSTGGGTSVTSEGPQYTADDIHYYKTAGQEITTITGSGSSRKYFKAYDGYCAVALANIGDGCGPVLVGEDPAQVCFTTDYKSGVVGAAGSVKVGGKTYYYSKSEYFKSGHFDADKKQNQYFSQYTTLEEVAKDVISKAKFEPVSESVKYLYTYSEADDGLLTVKAGPYFYTVTKAEIPAEVDGKTVGHIASKGFANQNNLQEVILPHGIKSIGDDAFLSCAQLHRAYVPSSVTKTGTTVFYKDAEDLYVFCGSAERPSGFQSNWATGAKRVFYGTKNYSENDEYLYAELIDGTILISLYKSEKADVVIPEKIDGKDVSTIGGYAFYQNATMESIALPSTLVEIRNCAFSEAKLITSIKIPYGVKTLGDDVFKGCPRLVRAYVPSSVTKTGVTVFYKGAEDLYVFCGATSRPDGFQSNWATGAKRVIYSSSGYIDDSDNIYSIYLTGYKLTLVGYVKNADGIISLPVDGKVIFNGKEYTITSIGTALKGDSNAYQVNLPSTITNIPDNAFYGCSNLASVTIPTGITYIGESAFYGTKFDTLGFAGTKDEWNAIAKSGSSSLEVLILNNSWKRGSSIKYVQCTDGKITL